MNGLEEKLTQILDSYEERIIKYENQVDSLESKLNFCSLHNFEEEKRITNVRLNEIEMIVYNWRNQQNEIRELLNAWLS